MANHLSITNPLYLAKNAPIEIKSRITSLANLTDITYPWVGMKFYSILEDKWYEVRTLKQGYLDYSTGSLTDVRPAGSEFVNFEIVPNLYIDTYRDDTSGQGQDGVGIDSILKTGEEGNYDIYTVTLTDARTYEIRVRQGVDGRGIVSVVETSVSGTIHTFTITYTDDTTSTFTMDIPGGGSGGYGPDNEYVSLDSLDKLTFANKVAGYDTDEQKIVYVKKDAVLNSAFFEANTRYVFKFKHNLGGAVIVFPPNVTLEFQGGRLENGTLTGNSTRIVAEFYLIFKDISITKTGTWYIEKAHSDWFNCAKDGYIIDYKTLDTRVIGTNVVTGLTTADVPLIGGVLPSVQNNTTTGYWVLGKTSSEPGMDTLIRVRSGQVPTLKLADDGVTYLFDEVTNLTYIYNGITYNVGTYTGDESLIEYTMPVNPFAKFKIVTKKPDGTTFTDDTFKLNQLLNLRANHTIIGNRNEIFMVRPILDNINNNSNNDDNQGLVFSNTFGKTLEINGIIKTIPNNANGYQTLTCYNNVNLNITGYGAIHGDIMEHLYTITSAGRWVDTGESGHCVNIAACPHLYFRNISIFNAWGDGIYTSWNKLNGALNYTDYQRYEDLTIANCRRTGIGFEKGDYAEFRRIVFDGHRNIRGTQTFAAIDIEPFNWSDAPQRYCAHHIFDNCTFSNYRSGPALRLERCLDARITNNAFYQNSNDICILQCHTGSRDRVTTTPLGNDRLSVFGGVIIEGNSSENSSVFVGSYGNIIDFANKAVVRNNTIKNISTFVGGCYFDECIIDNNEIINLSGSFLSQLNGKIVRCNNNTINHYTVAINLSASTSLIDPLNPAIGALLHSVRVDELYCNDLKIRDYSPLVDARYILDGRLVIKNPTTGLYVTSFPTELISENARIFGSLMTQCVISRAVITNVSLGRYNFNFNSIFNSNTTIGNLTRYNEYATSDLSTIDKLVTGDKLTMYGQSGVVTQGGYLRPFTGWKLYERGVTEAFTANMQMVLYNNDMTKIAFKTFNSGPTHNISFNTDFWNPDAVLRGRFTYIDNPIPIVQWDGVGRTDNIANVTLYNSNGRKMLETTTNVIYEYDGARFNIMDNVSVGLTAERPLKATTKDGFRYYDTELEIEYVYKKSIDDWIAIP